MTFVGCNNDQTFVVPNGTVYLEDAAWNVYKDDAACAVIESGLNSVYAVPGM